MFFYPPGNAFPPVLPPDKSRILQKPPWARRFPTPLWKDKQPRKALLGSCQPGLLMAQRKCSTGSISPSQSSLLTAPGEEEHKEWRAGAQAGLPGAQSLTPLPHTQKNPGYQQTRNRILKQNNSPLGTDLTTHIINPHHLPAIPPVVQLLSLLGNECSSIILAQKHPSRQHLHQPSFPRPPFLLEQNWEAAEPSPSSRRFWPGGLSPLPSCQHSLTQVLALCWMAPVRHSLI